MIYRISHELIKWSDTFQRLYRCWRQNVVVTTIRFW